MEAAQGEYMYTHIHIYTYLPISLTNREGYTSKRLWAGREVSSNKQVPKANHNVGLVTHHG